MSPNTNPSGGSLDYLRPSPVRGQLEPYSSKSPEGWRYLQTTDTRDELKVLLPPGTAAMYSQLLKLENYELTKKSSISWERIMEIRHLKDRMIRKCQRLAHAAPGGTKKISRGEPFVFQSKTAPSDFRLKEMEKWFREQQKRVNGTLAKRPSTSRHDTHGAGPSHSHPRPLPPAQPPLLLRSTTNPIPTGKGKHSSGQVHSSRPERSVSHPAAFAPTNIPSSVMSPPPLPVLLLAQREEYGLDSITAAEPISEAPPPVTDEDLLDPGKDGSGTNTPDSNGEGGSGEGHHRRRSCIKRNSMSDLVKRVSWADAEDLERQFSKYATAARHAEASGTWAEVQSLYIEQLKGLENLHEQVKEGLEHVRSESEHLQRIDETIRRHREGLEHTFTEFEQKCTLFREKVQAVLTNATDNQTRVHVRPELPPINEC